MELKGLRNNFSCFRRFGRILKPLILRNCDFICKNNCADLKFDLCTIFVKNQISCALKDALDGNGFKIPTGIVLHPDTSSRHKQMKEV